MGVLQIDKMQSFSIKSKHFGGDHSFIVINSIALNAR